MDARRISSARLSRPPPTTIMRWSALPQSRWIVAVAAAAAASRTTNAFHLQQECGTRWALRNPSSWQPGHDNADADAFLRTAPGRSHRNRSGLFMGTSHHERRESSTRIVDGVSSEPRRSPAVATFLLSSLLLLGAAALPYPSVAASSIMETNSPAVDSAISALQQSRGNAADTFKAFESIADIITEGKGVGGSINYRGVQLERGYVADEDTTIYNPGLTLLTEVEKTSLVRAVTEARSNSLQDGTWNEDSQLAYDFLKDKLDPLHMAELRGYLSVFPIVVGVAYVGALAVQQLSRELFPVAYVVAAVLVIAPALALVALGPS